MCSFQLIVAFASLLFHSCVMSGDGFTPPLAGRGSFVALWCPLTFSAMPSGSRTLLPHRTVFTPFSGLLGCHKCRFTTAEELHGSIGRKSDDI